MSPASPSDSHETLSPVSHPAPARDKAPLPVQFFGLLAGPVGWTLQHLVGYGLASHACYPGEVELLSPEPGWGGLRLPLAGLTLLALLLAVAGGWSAWRMWQRTRHERAGETRDIMNVAGGLTRFLAMSGLLISGLFAVAILFDSANLVGTPLCRG